MCMSAGVDRDAQGNSPEVVNHIYIHLAPYLPLLLKLYISSFLSMADKGILIQTTLFFILNTCTRQVCGSFGLSDDIITGVEKSSANLTAMERSTVRRYEEAETPNKHKNRLQIVHSDISPCET